MILQFDECKILEKVKTILLYLRLYQKYYAVDE